MLTYSSPMGAVLHRAVLFTLLLSVMAGPLSAQSGSTDEKRKGAPRIFAAQTGPDQVTLVWHEVPGATEYRIYLGTQDYRGLPPRTTRPAVSLSGSGRRAYLRGVQRFSQGAQLIALQAGQVLYQGTFNPVARAALSPVSPPGSVRAVETGATEVTVSWTAVPGATAYMIGRGVGLGGLRMACDLCPPVTEFVDTAATPGLGHLYTVQAVFPTGISARTLSNRLVLGAAQLAAATPPARQPTAWAPPGTPTSPTTTTASAPASAPTTWTPPGTPAGATSTAPPGTPAGATPVVPPGTPQPAADSVPPRVNPQIPATLPDTAPPSIGPLPSGADSLATPPADTGSCVAARIEPTQPTDTLERIDPRAERIEGRTTTNPDATTTANTTTDAITTTNLGSADYRQGRCLNPGATGYPDLWDPIATASGMTSAERVAAWKEIGIVALEYKHILGRQPTPEETRRDVAALRAGTTWYQLWRQLAHSAERDTRFGYWAAAPIPDSLQAQTDFGLTEPPWRAVQCSGGLGPNCGGLPEALNAVNDRVYAYWFGAFRLPDNTEFAYIEMGVAVGSILHDNACLKYKEGLNCNGLGAGDLIKNLPLGATGIPVLSAASLEWNKAAWNLIDGRTWRARFGPYPTNLAFRDRYWYDDLRPATPRPAMMAPAVSMFTWPGLTVTYTGGETRQSRALLAAGGTSLDATDVAFCRSGAFGSTGSFIGKAPWGICAGASTTGTHTASPVTTGTPTTGTPTTGTATPPASCKLDYRRADNMWAAFGRPDGFLGIESITLAAGEHKVFVTDWKYEKQRNDGTTYYGSHLRVATNVSSRPVRLQLISGAGAVTSSVRLDPNTTKEFQADLRDVYCEP